MDLNRGMSLSLLAATLRIVPDPVWFKDTKCRYVFCNEAYEAFSGFSSQDIVGKTDYDLFSRDIADVIVKHDMQAMLSFTPIAVWRTFYGKNESAWIDTVVTKLAVRDESGLLMGVLCMRRTAVAPDDEDARNPDNKQVTSTEAQTFETPQAPAVVTHSDEKYALEADIRRGIDANEFTTFFQPKIDLSCNRIVGAEALVRWKHPKRGHIPPSMFLPMAEATGLILPINELVLGNACQLVSEWNTQSQVPHTVSVNLSYTPMVDGSLLPDLMEMLKAQNCSPNVLEFEITEALINTHSHVIEEVLMHFHDIGIGIVIDDFGSGHLDFTHLMRLPIKTLKIDRVFVKNVDDNPKASALLHAMVAMTHELGMEAVAEGVETLLDRNRVKDAGCDVAQGYYWSKPLAKEEFLEWTRNFTSDASRKIG
jgi:EAL domain-containing protein (putative c-di-GMP-specific phosphodiesterase class I)